MRRLTLKRTIILIVFMAIFAMAVRVVVDTDVYWHLATGRYISQTGIPQGDPFSFTKRGQPWVDIQWLPQLGLYLIYTGFGLNGLMIVVALGVVAVMFFVWKQLAGGVWLQAGILLLTAIATSEVWTVRPQLLTLLLVAALNYVLYLYKWRKIDRLWIIPIMYVLWANLHGGYIIGLMLIGAMIAGESLRLIANKLWPDRIAADVADLTWRQVRKLIFIALISVAVLVINPYTLGVLELPFKTVDYSLTSIAEWNSPNFHDILQQPVIWLLLLTLCAVGWSGRRLDVTDALTFSLFAALVFLVQRNMGLFAIVCAPILARYAAAALEGARWQRRSMPPGYPFLNAILLLLVAVAVILKVALVLPPAIRSTAEEQALPVHAADWIEQHQPSGAMFNSYNWGGYLIWRLSPAYPVFIDGRADVYEMLFAEYLRVISLQTDAEALFDQYHIGFIVIEQNSPLAVALATLHADRWQLAYRDEQAVIFVRRA